MELKWNGSINMFLKIKEINSNVFINAHTLMYFDKDNELHKIYPDVEIVVESGSIKENDNDSLRPFTITSDSEVNLLQLLLPIKVD